MEIFSLIALALITAGTILLIKQYHPEMALVLSIAASAVMLITILSKAEPLLNTLSNLIKQAGIKNEYLTIMVKSLGICYLSQFSADICNDFGQTSLGSKITFCGKILISIISLPMIVSIINMLTKMIG